MNSTQYPEQYPDPQQDYVAEDQLDAPINFDDENGEDPLKRNTKFSWKSFGGDGFIVSVVLHAALIIFALLYVVSTVQPKEEEPAEFVSGAGGGNNGENANRQQHRMRPKPRDMSTQNKITSKSKNASLTLPEMPKMNTSMGSMGGMKAGGASSGLGGGAGGGIGTGMGPGIGNGRAFLSKFGMSGPNMGGIVGTFYDLKQREDGSDSDMKQKTPDSMSKYLEIGRSVVKLKGMWTTKPLERYFKGENKLGAPAQIFIPFSDAQDAPKAFGLKNEGQRWYIHYRGNVKANKTGKIRLIGSSDDLMCVRLGNVIALDSGYDLMTEKSNQGQGPGVKRVLGVEGPSRPALPGFGSIRMRVGPTIDIRAGQKIPFECLIGETPGGKFLAVLLFEELNRKGEVVGKPKLMRFSSDPVDDTLVDEIKNSPHRGAWNNQIDLSGGNWVFQPVK